MANKSVVYSIDSVPIRLPAERWEHIVGNKPYMELYYDEVLEAVRNPAWILRGYAGAKVGVLPLGKRGYLHVVYREVNRDDGFVITAFISQKVNKEMIIWPKKF